MNTTTALVDSPWMSTEDVSRYLGVSMKTVEAWRHRGVGPPGHRIGKHVRYDRAEVDAWVRRDTPAASW